MTCAQVIHQMRMAGYHGDTVALAILHNAASISKPQAKQAYQDGQRLRAKGIRCGCNICVPKSTK